MDNKIHFGIAWENTALGPGTKLPYILCTAIGPLQLGVVLVFSFIHTGLQSMCTSCYGPFR